MARKIEIKQDRNGDYLHFTDGPFQTKVTFEKGVLIIGCPIKDNRDQE